MYRGIDVSYYQGNINWNAVKQSGIDFVIIRAGYGRLISQKDVKFEEYYAGAKAAGLMVGTYWYSYAMSAAEARIEADCFLQAIKGKTFDYPLFYDVEEKNQRGIVNEIIPAFLEKVKAAGYYVGLYTFYDMSKAVSAQIKNTYDVWIAHTGVNKTPYTGHTMWQYSWTLKVPGIPNSYIDGVDGDYCYVDYPAKIKGAKSVVEQPKEEPKPVQQPTQAPTANPNLLHLNNTPLYTSSTAKNASGTKTGTFYKYDDKVVNGRIRITNSAANVGKVPIGNYVTGWIDAPTSTVAPVQEAKKEETASAPAISAGRKVNLSSVDLFTSSTAKNPSGKKSGTFYLYDNKVLNGRIRITNTPGNVGRTPIGNYVTGWISASDVK